MTIAIHATLGPSSKSGKTLQQLVQSGATALRINLSHVQQRELPGWFSRVREALGELEGAVPLGVDIRGRKLRIGLLPGGHQDLPGGAGVQLVPATDPDRIQPPPGMISVGWPGLVEGLQPDDELVLGDGAVRLVVKKIDRSGVRCKVTQGGSVSSRCGFHLIGRRIELPPLSLKDEQDLDALAELRPGFIYLSFLESAEDVAVLRGALHQRGLDLPIVAKIERACAIDDLEHIAGAADSICLSRGDLGVELPLAQLPAAQRKVAAFFKERHQPVLLAGEVLWSLNHRSVPARGDICDLQLAHSQGYNGFVLSDETATGPDPVGAVRWLKRLLEPQEDADPTA